jgi:hypothetical protein
VLATLRVWPYTTLWSRCRPHKRKKGKCGEDTAYCSRHNTCVASLAMQFAVAGTERERISAFGLGILGSSDAFNSCWFNRTTFNLFGERSALSQCSQINCSSHLAAKSVPHPCKSNCTRQCHSKDRRLDVRAPLGLLHTASAEKMVCFRSAHQSSSRIVHRAETRRRMEFEGVLKVHGKRHYVRVAAGVLSIHASDRVRR